jgi:eukaryotic-like serine/threonine-protein kinase
MALLDDLRPNLEMIAIGPGDFWLGTDVPSEQMYFDEMPARKVTIDYSFFVGKYPITFAEFLPFLKSEFPTSAMRHFFEYVTGQTPRLPSVMVTWHEAVAFCSWMSLHSSDRYRLLTETEWEYACRAGTTTNYWWGDDFDASRANNRYEYLRDGSPSIPKSYAQVVAELDFLTPVDRYPPNPWGLHDMHGNTWEWVEDIYDDPRSQLNMAPREGEEPFRATRGGSWMDPPGSLRAATRSWSYPTMKDRICSFRIARSW